MPLAVGQFGLVIVQPKATDVPVGVTEQPPGMEQEPPGLPAGLLEELSPLATEDDAVLDFEPGRLYGQLGALGDHARRHAIEGAVELCRFSGFQAVGGEHLVHDYVATVAKDAVALAVSPLEVLDQVEDVPAPDDVDRTVLERIPGAPGDETDQVAEAWSLPALFGQRPRCLHQAAGVRVDAVHAGNKALR